MSLNLPTTRLKNERGTRTKVMVMPTVTVAHPAGRMGPRMAARTVLRDTGMGRAVARRKRGEEPCLLVC